MYVVAAFVTNRLLVSLSEPLAQLKHLTETCTVGQECVSNCQRSHTLCVSSMNTEERAAI